MRINLPIACSLEGDALELRTHEWEQTLVGVTGRNPIPGGVELRFVTSDVREQLQVLVDREAECCPWMTMRITDRDEGLSLSISSADAMGERQIHEWFGPART